MKQIEVDGEKYSWVKLGYNHWGWLKVTENKVDNDK